jgi:DNA-binding NtrC family response regulator
VLIVEDEAGIRLALTGLLRRESYEVVQCEDGADALARLDAEAFDFVLTDLALGAGPSGLDVLRFTKERQPETPVVMITAHGNEKIAVEAMKLGADDYVPKPFDNDEIRLVVRRALERTRLARENRELRARIERDFGMGSLIGRGAAMRQVFETIRKVAETDLTVLVRGESGTGKELVAQALHEASARKSGPFVAVNCAAIGRELVESELFGHEKGAFTGADARRIGRFEAAHGGTIFLDEIGDMAPDTQAKVLRVLQERTFERVGGTKPIQVDVRVVAATHRDLEKDVAARRFREDLYYRVSVIPVEVPPLRDRPEDIPELVRHFVTRAAKELNIPEKAISAEAVDLLERYHWPGNIRELENELRKAMALTAQDAEITADDLSLEIQGDRAREEPVIGAAGVAAEDDGTLRGTVERAERAAIEKALEDSSGNQTRAAKRLGISRVWLRKKMERYGLLAKEGNGG